MSVFLTNLITFRKLTDPTTHLILQRLRNGMPVFGCSMWIRIYPTFTRNWVKIFRNLNIKITWKLMLTIVTLCIVDFPLSSLSKS